MEEKKLYTLLVYSENVAGILNQVTAVFTRRQVNIESLNVSASSIPGVHKYTITAWSDEDQIIKIVHQIEKKIDVVKANYFTDDQLFIRESGLYKLATQMVLENPEVSRTIRYHRGEPHIYHCDEVRTDRGYHLTLPRSRYFRLCIAIHPFRSYRRHPWQAGTGEPILGGKGTEWIRLVFISLWRSRFIVISGDGS